MNHFSDRPLRPVAMQRRVFLQQSLLGLSAGSLLSTRALAAPGMLAEPRFQLSLHQYSLKKLFDAGQLDLPGYAEFAKNRFSIQNIEFAAEFCEELFSDLKKGEAIRQRANRNGVTIRALLCAADHPLDVASAEQRAAAVAHHVQWASVADSLGCEFLRVRAASEGDPQKQLDYAVNGIGALCDALHAHKVNVLIENITGPSRDPEWLVQLVEKIGRDRIGLIADFGNFEGDLYAGMKRLLPYTKSLCTKSWEFDGAGNETKIDFRRMFEIIQASDFRGCIAIEYLGEEPIAGIRQTAELIRRNCQAGDVG